MEAAVRRGTRGLRRDRHGVSEVVATVLLLAMTMALFSGLFVVLQKAPTPAPQQANQFLASVQFFGSTQSLSNVSVMHLSGPVLAGTSTAQAAIGLHSQGKPNAFPTLYTLSQGLKGGSSAWAFGQNWTVNVASAGVSAPDVLSVAVFQQGKIIFETSITLGNTGSGPYFTATRVTPNPLGNVQFNVSASVTCWSACASTNAVTADIGQLEKGVSTIETLTCTASTKTATLYTATCYWTSAAVPASGMVANASYFVVLTVTDSAARYSTVLVPVTGSSSSGGGGGVSSPPALDGSVKVTASNPATITPMVTTTKTNDLLLLALATDQQSAAQTASSVTDGFGLTWAEEGTPYKYSSATGPGTIGPAYLYLFYALTGAHAPGSDTVTVSFSGTTAVHTVSAILLAFSGVSTSTPWDPAGTVTNSATTGTATVAPNSLTTTFQYDAVVAFVGVQTSVAPSGPAGWAGGTTEVSSPTDFTAYLNYDLVSATGTYVASVSWAMSHAWGLVEAAIEG